MSVAAVVFDLGRVVINWDPEAFYDRVIGPARRVALFDAVPLHEVNLDVDRGAPFRDSIYALAERHPEHAEAIRYWHDRWIEMAPSEICGSVRLIHALRAQGTPLYALTNFGTGPLAVAERAYPVLTLFDRRFVSGELQVVKPDPQIYEILERDTGHAPETLLFTDDKQENIDVAAARGWKTHLFEGPEGWAARLVAEGVLAKNPL